MSADTARLAAALDASARHWRHEAGRYRGADRIGTVVRIDPGKGQADPAAYAAVCTVLAEHDEQLARAIREDR